MKELKLKEFREWTEEQARTELQKKCKRLHSRLEEFTMKAEKKKVGGDRQTQTDRWTNKTKV